MFRLHIVNPFVKFNAGLHRFHKAGKQRHRQTRYRNIKGDQAGVYCDDPANYCDQQSAVKNYAGLACRYIKKNLFKKLV
jgi:hypothetical protein